MVRLLSIAIGLSLTAGPVFAVEHTKDTPDTVKKALADKKAVLLDVREQAEWDAGHIPGSSFTSWHDIAEVPAGLDPARPIAVLCASGQRAATAASLVQRHGGQGVIHVVGGGVPRWGRLGQPLETGA